MSGRNPVGLVLGSSIAPEYLAPSARRAEELGFGELWFAEDYFFTGGISGATASLAATREIPIGLGIVSAVARHPAVLAMEIATIERMFPGRFIPGIGVGVPSWVRQMGLMPRSPLSAVRECVTAVRALLGGETVNRSGNVFGFDDVALSHPPEPATAAGAREVPIYMGPIGPKMLQLSGEVADGSLLSVLCGADYIRWARGQIATGAAASGRDPSRHRLTAFAMYSVGPDGAAAKQALRPVMAFYFGAGPKSALSEVYGITDRLLALLDDGGVENLAAEMPDRWIEDLAVAGDPGEVADKIRALLDAGADSVALFPIPAGEADRIVEVTATEVLPRL